MSTLIMLNTNNSAIINKRIMPEFFDFIRFVLLMVAIWLLRGVIELYASEETRYIIRWIWALLILAFWIVFIGWILYMAYGLYRAQTAQKNQVYNGWVNQITWTLNKILFTTVFFGKYRWIDLELEFSTEWGIQVYTDKISLWRLHYRQFLEFFTNYDSWSRWRIDSYLERNQLVVWFNYTLEWWFQDEKIFSIMSIIPSPKNFIDN